MDLKEKRRQETKKDTGLMKQTFAIVSFDVVSFMKQSKEDRK